MEKLLTLSFLFLYCLQAAGQQDGEKIPSLVNHIRIEHLGPEDKPFPVLIIASREISTHKREWLVLVSRAVFDAAAHEVRTSPLKNSNALSDPMYGTFRVKLSIGGEQQSYYLATHSNAIRFFTGLRNSVMEIENQSQLENHLTALLRRIDSGPDSR